MFCILPIFWVALAVVQPINAACNAPVPSFVGDGYCDDGQYNNAACNWDGGDCCEETCQSTELYQCGVTSYICLNPGVNSAHPTLIPPTRSPTFVGCNVENPGNIGDGFCDYGAYNTEACLWDGGDCCVSTCVSSPSATCGVNGYDCHTDPPEPSVSPTLKPTSLCKASELFKVGDGFCDGGVEYNNPACDWDGGDCCTQTCVSFPNPCGANGFACLQPEYSNAPTRLPTLNPSTARPSTAIPTAATLAPTLSLAPSTALPTVACYYNCPSYQFTSAAFNNEGTEVVMSFDGPMDQGGYYSEFPCNYLTSFAGSEDATCVWLTNRILSARLGGGKLLVGDPVTVLGGVLKRACSSQIDCASSLTMPEKDQSVLAPASPVSPIIVFRTLAKVINECDKIRLDAAGSRGRGPGTWFMVSWEVSGSGVDNEAVILSELAAYGNRVSAPIEISNAGFTLGTVTVTMTIANAIGGVLNSTVSIEVTDAIVPAVSVYGLPKQTFFRNERVTLQAFSFIPACLSDLISELTYSWAVLDSARNPLPIQSGSNTPSRFSVPANTFDVGSFIVVVSSTPDMGIAAAYEVELHIESRGASVVVRGGSMQTASELAEFTLDASGSYHPSYPNDPSTVLSFTWSCAMASGESCGLGALGTSSMLVFAAGELPAASETYLFSLALTSNRDSIVSLYTVRVNAVSDAIPSITITNVEAKYNPQDVVAVGSVLGPLDINEAYEASWSVSPAVVSDAISSSTSLSLSGSVSSLYDFPFSFFANKLSAGVTYTLTLKLSLAGSPDAASFSSVTVKMNIPPYNGAVSVSPPSGTSLITIYTVASDGWVFQLDSLPIVYTLTSAVGDGSTQVLLQRSTSSFVESVLPPGLDSEGNTVTCFAIAADAYGSRSRSVSNNVIVLPASSLLAVGDLVSDLVLAAEATQNFLQLAQVVGVGAGSVNYADCSAAPDCSGLNRKPCSTTTGTCGVCLGGYIGVDGPSNEICNSIGERRLAESACTAADTSCHKKCPHDCSGAGTCEATDFAGEVIDFCAVNDITCRVGCICDPGSYGNSCSLDSEEYDIARRTRDSICSSFYRSLLFEDVSPEIVSSRLVLTSLILLDSAQISEFALTNCTTVVTETVFQFSELVSSDDVVPLVVDALSLALNSKGLMSASLLNDTYTAIEVLLASAQSSSASSIEVITQNIRVSSTVQSLDDIMGGGLVLTVPTSLFEISMNTPSTRVMLTENDLTDSDPTTFGLSIVQYTNNPSGAISTSSIVSLQTTYNVTNVDGSGKALNFTIVLQNTAPISYVDESAEELFLECEQQADSLPYTIIGNCSGVLYQMTCPGNVTAEIVYVCPFFDETPACNNYGDNGLADDKSICVVRSYTDTTTTCACSLPLNTLTIGTKASASNIGSGFLVVVNSFLYTWRTIDTLSASDVVKNAVIFGCMVGLICALVVGIIFFGYRDIDHIADKHRQQQEVSITISEFFEKVIPKQFEESAWPVRFIKVLSERHSYLCFLFPLAEGDYRTCQWLILIGKLINYAFVGTLLTVFFFGDDGTCERQDTKGTCLALKGPDFKTSVCGWNDQYEFCEYVAPPESFMTLIILALAINVLCVPLDMILYYGVGQYKALLSHYSELRIKKMREEDAVAFAADPESRHGVVSVMHELKAYPSRKATIIRAARLTKMISQIDHLEVNAEVAILMSYDGASHEDASDQNAAINLLADYVTPTKRDFKSRVSRKATVGKYLVRQGVTGKNAFDGRSAIVKKSGRSATHNISRDSSVNNLSTTALHVGGDSQVSISRDSDSDQGVASKLAHISYQQLLRRNIKLSRARAEKIKRRINLLGTDERKEIYLVRKFLVDNMIGIRRLVANRFFFGSFNDEFAYARKNMTYVKCVAAFVPIYLAVICLYIFLYGVTLGSRSTGLWMVSIGISYLQDIALLEVCSLYMVNVVLVSIVYKDLKLLSNRLRKRAKAILNRVDGQMSLARCYLQHLNAACRAARSCTSLGMSRLLMSLNDFDMPKAFVPRYHKPQSKWYFLFSFLIVIKNFFVLMYLSLPDSFQDAIIETFVCCALNLFFIAVYLGTVVSGDNETFAGIFVFFLVMLIIMLPMTKSFRLYIWNLVFPKREDEKYDVSDQGGDDNYSSENDETFENGVFKDLEDEAVDSESDEDDVSYGDDTGFELTVASDAQSGANSV